MYVIYNTYDSYSTNVIVYFLSISLIILNIYIYIYVYLYVYFIIEYKLQVSNKHNTPLDHIVKNIPSVIHEG